ncbi:MAG: hypothetical protein ABI614_26325, partial [Planctomycetota bacterium]
MFHCLAGTQAGQLAFGARRGSCPLQMRRPITALATVFVAALVAPTIVTKPANAEPSKRPNIVLIMADDMGFS